MRLCFVGNPGSIHTQRWVGHFAQAGHETHLVNLGPQPARKFDWPGPQHHNLPAPPMAPMPGLRGVIMLMARRRALAALLKQIQPDVLHAHSVADPGWFAALSGFHPFVLTAWGSDVLLGLHRGPLASSLADPQRAAPRRSAHGRCAFGVGRRRSRISGSAHARH